MWGTNNMDSSNALAQPLVDPGLPDGERPAAVLRGTARGLEIFVVGTRKTSDICSEIVCRLDEAPAFFRGSDVRIRVEDGPLPTGCLARLDEVAEMFELRIIEVTAVKHEEAVPEEGDLADGSAPVFEDEPTNATNKLIALPAAAPEEPVCLPVEDVVDISVDNFDEPTQTAVPRSLAATPEIELATATGGTRVVVGPVRSGVILHHTGHLIVFGDINPGAEVRATGNIVVLGRLRGTAHAGIGQDVGFILALRLEPQQIRIGRQVARAGDSDKPASQPELAYGTGGGIIVEPYEGKLPRNLAISI